MLKIANDKIKFYKTTLNHHAGIGSSHGNRMAWHYHKKWNMKMKNWFKDYFTENQTMIYVSKGDLPKN